MKKILIIAVVLFLAQFCLADEPPAYTNGQWYVWSDGAVATNALNYVNTSGWFPVIGKNAKTGEDNSEVKVTKWQQSVSIRKDGKFCFPRIPESMLDLVGVPAEQRGQFFTVFGPTLEMYQDGWFPSEEDE